MAYNSLALKDELFLAIDLTEKLLDDKILLPIFQELVKAIHHLMGSLERHFHHLSDPRSKQTVANLLSQHSPYIKELRSRTKGNTLNTYFDDLCTEANYLEKEFSKLASGVRQIIATSPVFISPIHSPVNRSHQATIQRNDSRDYYSKESLQVKELLQKVSRRKHEITGLAAQNDRLQNELVSTSGEVARLQTVNDHLIAEAAKAKSEKDRMLSHVQSLHTAVRNINALIPMPDLQDDWNVLDSDLPGLVRTINSLNLRLQDFAFTRRGRAEPPAIESSNSSSSNRAIMPPPHEFRRMRPFDRSSDIQSTIRRFLSRTLHYKPWKSSSPGPWVPIRDEDSEKRSGSERYSRGRARRRRFSVT